MPSIVGQGLRRQATVLHLLDPLIEPVLDADSVVVGPSTGIECSEFLGHRLIRLVAGAEARAGDLLALSGRWVVARVEGEEPRTVVLAACFDPTAVGVTALAPLAH